MGQQAQIIQKKNTQREYQSMHHIPDRLLSPARLQTTALQRIGIKLYCYAGGLLIAPMTRLFLFFELHEKIAKNDYEKLKTSKTLNQCAPDCAPLVFPLSQRLFTMYIATQQTFWLICGSMTEYLLTLRNKQTTYVLIFCTAELDAPL